jgi:hypothetical protein
LGKKIKSIARESREFNSEEICFRKEYKTATRRPRKGERYFAPFFLQVRR